MTIPGVDAIAAISILAAVGDFSRFTDPHKLVAYVGPNPTVRQSGNSAPVHGRISRAGCAHVSQGAGGGGVVGQPHTGTAAGVLRPDQSPARLPEGHRRDRPKTDRPILAPGHQRFERCAEMCELVKDAERVLDERRNVVIRRRSSFGRAPALSIRMMRYRSASRLAAAGGRLSCRRVV